MDERLRVLLTGFESFGGEKLNPSELVVKRISKKKFDKCVINILILPVSYEKSVRILEDYYSKNTVDVAIHLGQAGGRAVINIERVAVNIIDSKNPDNDKKIIQDRKIIPSGLDAYMTRLDAKKIVELLNKKKIPANISYDAGQYVCNVIYYFSLHKSYCDKNPKNVLFVHLPFLPQQVCDKYPKNSNIPSMALQLQVKAVEEILKNIKELSCE
ncbi:MAG: pyroglutamyl-peptidase I [Fervidobacterium sp.]